MTDWAPPPPPPPPPPPLVPSGGYTWSPTGVPPIQPESFSTSTRRPAPGTQQRRGGILGGLAAAAAAFAKWGLVLLKFGKFGGTAVSFAFSLLIYIGIFGWQFGLGALLLIAAHEVGHMVFARAQGLPSSPPIFLAFLAFVRTPGVRTAREGAVVAIGGPAFGTAAALACYVAAQSMGPTHLRNLLLALAYFGCFVNLLNLVPISWFDGGRVAAAVPRSALLLGLGVVGALIAAYLADNIPLNPFLVIFLLAGAYTTWHRFRAGADRCEPSITTRTRVVIGIAYVAILIASAVGMSAAHSVLLDGGIGQQIV